MDELVLTIEKIIELLNILGYEVDNSNQIPLFEPLTIKKNNKKVGELSLKRKNLYYLNQDNIPVENLNLKRMRFSRDKEKNTRDLVHVSIKDDMRYFNCYNAVLNKESNPKVKFVKISDDYFSIRDYSYGINVSVNELDKKYFVYNNDSNITIREGNDTSKDIIIKDNEPYDYDYLDSIIDEVYDYTGIDIIIRSINYFQKQTEKKSKKYINSFRGE